MQLNCQYFQENHPSCTVCQRGRQVLVEENKRKYTLQNLSERKVCKVKIDNCVITSQSQRKCDYLIIVCEPQETIIHSSVNLFLVELKGRDLLSAVEQITETIKYFQAENHRFMGKVFARVVLSKVAIPKSIEVDSRVIALKKLIKKLDGDFKYSSVRFIDDCV